VLANCVDAQSKQLVIMSLAVLSSSLTFTKLISTMASDTAVFTPWLKHFTKFHSTVHQTLRMIVDINLTLYKDTMLRPPAN